jgi:hypothetical protein
LTGASTADAIAGALVYAANADARAWRWDDNLLIRQDPTHVQGEVDTVRLRSSAATIASRPSVNAAGPGCKMSGDLISKMPPFRTAGRAAHPGRSQIRRRTTFLPHHEARMTSGAAAMTASEDTMRSFAHFFSRNSGKMSSPPAIPTNSDTQPTPLTAAHPIPRNRLSALAARARTRSHRPSDFQDVARELRPLPPLRAAQWLHESSSPPTVAGAAAA